ncbi:MAG: hypothetical protein V1735_00555 [Nanoarchaeota archaeon]
MEKTTTFGIVITSLFLILVSGLLLAPRDDAAGQKTGRETCDCAERTCEAPCDSWVQGVGGGHWELGESCPPCEFRGECRCSLTGKACQDYRDCDQR